MDRVALMLKAGGPTVILHVSELVLRPRLTVAVTVVLPTLFPVIVP